MRVQFRMFKGVFKSWQALFTEACEFATGVGAERLINISHSSDQAEAVITVWYWE